MNSPVKVKIIVPLYRGQLSDEEQQSLHQTIKVLARYPIVFIAPEGVNITPVTDLFSGHEVLRVSDEWLGTKNGIAGYNRMMMSRAFYELFADTESLLICQTDVWIFRDELDAWCKRGYDYIGAPHLKLPVYHLWPLRAYLALRRKMVKGVLRQDLMGRAYNGGLSLRRTASFIRACEAYRDEAEQFLSHDHHLYNEDVFWSLVPEEFIYPNQSEALLFAFDVKPEYCYELTKKHLPFGCHGWFKPSVRKFWQSVIR